MQTVQLLYEIVLASLEPLRETPGELDSPLKEAASLVRGKQILVERRDARGTTHAADRQLELLAECGGKQAGRSERRTDRSARL